MLKKALLRITVVGLTLIMLFGEIFFISPQPITVAAEEDPEVVTETIVTTEGDILTAIAVPKVTGFAVASADFDTIKISYTPITTLPGVEYQIYRSTNKKTGYKLVDQIVGDTYLDGGLKTGTVYYYKVRAVFDDGLGTISKGAFTAIKSAKPSLKKAEFSVAPAHTPSGKSSITVTVDPINGATGYQYSVKPKVKNGKWSKAKVAATNTYTITGLAGNRDYDVRVRAYRKVGKKVFYGAYTTIQSCFVDRSVPVDFTSFSITKMKVPTKGLLPWGEFWSGKILWVEYEFTNNETVPVKLQNNILYGSQYYGYTTNKVRLANGKGKNVSSITVKPGQTVKIRFKAKKIGRIQYYWGRIDCDDIFFIKAVYDGVTYGLTLCFDEVYVH